MENIIEHASKQVTLLIIFIVAAIIIMISLPYFLRQRKLYGTMFEFAAQGRKILAGIACVALVGLGFYGMTPYIAPPSDEIAIILGNTQNTPAPSITGSVSDAVVATMLKHKGDDISKLAESIKVVSATKNPEVIDMDVSELKLKQIGNNTSNAKRDARLNIEAIEKKLNNLAPTNNGSNYLEAIMEARDNVGQRSNIIVIGSGLSDSGDVNFSKSNLLTNENSRKKALGAIQDKYGASYLAGYNIEFYGLGDTTAPQEPLSNIQKGIMRDFYRDVIKKLGGNVTINTESQTGLSVKTTYVVGTTDTGCGDIKLVFDDDDLKFMGDRATFIDEASAVKSLSTIKDLWVSQKDTIEHIQIDGYIAHYQTAKTLSQDRADAVKKTLVNLGITSEKITATGQGFGPYDTDAQNRSVKVNISRNNQQCMN